MASRRSGHFVQVNRPRWDPSKGRRRYVEVMGRTIALEGEGNRDQYWDKLGWIFVSRECTKRDAKKIAKAYREAGFNSRVVFTSDLQSVWGNQEDLQIIATYKRKGDL